MYQQQRRQQTQPRAAPGQYGSQAWTPPGMPRQSQRGQYPQFQNNIPQPQRGQYPQSLPTGHLLEQYQAPGGQQYQQPGSQYQPPGGQQYQAPGGQQYQPPVSQYQPPGGQQHSAGPGPDQLAPPPPTATPRVSQPQSRVEPPAPAPGGPPPEPSSHRAPRNIRDDVSSDRSPFMLTTSSPRAELGSYGSPLQLKPHQLAVLKRLGDVERNHSNSHRLGILKDKAGAGKTFCILALIMQEKLAHPDINRTNIVVVTNSLIGQWREAIDKFNTGSDTPLTYSDFTTYATVASLYHGTLNQYTDIMLTTNSYADTIIQACEVARLAVDRIVFDECDTIEWSIHKDGAAGFIWFVSASFTHVPEAYVSRVKNLTALQMESCSVWCDKDFVDTVWQLPPLKVNKVKCTSTYIDVVMRSLLDEEQLQRVNAGDYHKLPFNMSNKVPQNDKEAVETIQESCRDQIALNEPIIEDLQTRIKAMMNNPERTALMDQVKSLKQLVRDQRSALEIITKELASVEKHVPSDKLKRTMQVLKETKGKGYTLIYSKFLQPLQQLSEMLDAADIKHCSLDAGSIEEVEKVLAKYKAGEIPVFLAHAGLFAAGVNLEMTTDICMLHRMDPLMEHQIIGRGQRSGRTCSLRVWFLLHDNEINKTAVKTDVAADEQATGRPPIQADD